MVCSNERCKEYMWNADELCEFCSEILMSGKYGEVRCSECAKTMMVRKRLSSDLDVELDICKSCFSEISFRIRERKSRL